MKQWFKAGVFLLFATTSLFSQEKLTLEQALAIALKNNYDIQIARNGEANADEDLVQARSMFMPKASVSLKSATYEYKIDEKDFSTGLPTGSRVSKTASPFEGSFGVNLNLQDVYGAVLGYMESLETTDRVKESTKERIQQLLFTVTQKYYGLIEQKNLLEVRKRSVETNQKQVERAQSKFEIGSIAKKDVYTAKVQLNNAKVNLLNQKLNVRTAENDLNILLGRNAFDSIDIYDNVKIENKYTSYDEIKNQLVANNPTLKVEEFKIKEADLAYDRMWSNMYLPKLNLTAGYNKSAEGQTNFGNVFDKVSDTKDYYTLSASIGVTYTLFNGFSDQASLEKAEIAKHNAELSRAKVIQETHASLYQAFITYENRLEMLKLQEENLVASQEEFRLAQERFNIGSGTSLELKEAQDGVVRAESDLVSAKFQAKIAEVDIDRLLGLIKIN